jgi:acyl-CoA reductase-like NAD-dependent aldehyde dehydrogenase
MTYRTINPATGETVRTFGDISDADLDNAVEPARFGEFVNRKLVNAAPAGAPPWGPVPVP